MAASDLVSIVMPAFNSEQFIEKAIRSVIDQTYSNWELLVCDDGSTDNTKDIIRSFADDRIIYVGESARLGAFAARNMLIKRSSGAYVTFLDADDYIDIRRIELQVNKFESSPHLGHVHQTLEIPMRFPPDAELQQAIQTIEPIVSQLMAGMTA